MASAPSQNQSSLARFAFNIYGSLNERQKPPEKTRPPPSRKLKYVCDREITCVAPFDHPLGRLGSAVYDSSSSAHHVLIGGKNYLKLLALNADQSAIVSDFSLLDLQAAPSRLHAPSRLFNVNTIKSKNDLVACGLTSGSVHIYQVSSSGKARLAHRLDDHKRVVNSVDFAEDSVLFSGSQDGSVRLWDLRSFSHKPALKLSASQHADPVRSCQYSPHSRSRGRYSVLSVHDSGALCKFDLRYPNSASGTTLPERKWTFHTGPALSLHIHPELEYVLTGGRDRKICLWNYGDSSSNSMTPDTIVNTYGPVMKVRWNDTPHEEPVDFDDTHKNGLYSYDFACSYLNDDPSICVYNLARRHVPTEIVNTISRKPFQNFVWAKTAPGNRTLWTITKANVFVSYDLDSGTAQNVSRPLDSLPAVATAWGGQGLSVVSQDTDDYDGHAISGEPELPERPFSEDLRDDDRDFQASPVSVENAFVPARTPQNHPAPTYFYQKNPVLSPKERPILPRSATQHSQPSMASSLGIRPAHDLRPMLHKNSSQTTVDSASSGGTFAPILGHGSHFGSPNKHLQNAFSHPPSPYIVSMAMPLPLADEAVFAALAHDYLTGVPDAFTLSFVCQINARVAASVQRFRDCQTWRMISVALEQEEAAGSAEIGTRFPHTNGTEAEPAETQATGVLSRSPESKSISSDLGNVVGSYNSDSTSTTNYGSGPRKRSSMNNISILGSSRESSRDVSMNARSLSMEMSAGNKSPKRVATALSDVSHNDAQVESLSKLGQQDAPDAPNLPDIDIPPDQLLADNSEDSRLPNLADSPENSKFHAFSSKARPISARRSSLSGGTRDLDDENMNVLTNASASFSSSAFSAGTGPTSGFHPQAISFGSRDSQAGSWQSPGKNFQRSARTSVPTENKISLDRVEETSVKSKENRVSGLTRAMSGYAKEDAVFRPWLASNIIQKSLEYALAQGDLVMSSTLILLFYGHFRANYADALLEAQNCLEVLALYIETLRARELYTIAVQVVKDSPDALKEKLSAYAVKEVEMRFYCCWCKKLLANEVSKEKYGVESDKFGFWYCDECSRKQSNCVYCNEPCKGLTVVESLRCGHRGHFGCFQEWHIEDGNGECPGGCE